MLIYVRLSGEHRTLPLAELRAVLEAEGVIFKEIIHADQVVVLEIPKIFLNVLMKRLSLTTSIGMVAGIYSRSSVKIREIINDLTSILGKATKVNFIYDRIKGRESLKYEEIRRELKRQGFKLSSKNYEKVIEIISSDLIISGVRLFRRSIHMYEDRAPQRRPIYRPGTLTPQVARLFVNLSRASRKNSPYVDPFCGVGGFLLEACVMGINEYLGVEISSDYAIGARINLLHYGCLPNVVVGDACNIPVDKAGAIGTDPPYGRMTGTVGRRLRDLMLCFLEESAKILRKGSYLVFAQKRGVINEEDILKIDGLELVEKHLNWVHGSLTRDIYVVRRY